MGLPFPVNMNRFMPLPSNCFLVYFGQSTSPVALVKKVSKLDWSIEAHEYKCGGSPITFTGPGRLKKFDPIRLERGLTYSREFVEWASAAHRLDKGVATRSLKNMRQQLIIVLKNEAGQDNLRFVVNRAWVSLYQALPELDAESNAVAIELIEVQHEGWEQDLTLKEPKEI
jgi:phage tail-like protein